MFCFFKASQTSLGFKFVAKSISSTICFFIIFLTQPDNTNAIEFIGSKRYKEKVNVFINELLQRRDFYLIEKKDNLILLAAADFSGHGVRGALISIVNYNFLIKVILEKIYLIGLKSLIMYICN